MNRQGLGFHHGVGECRQIHLSKDSQVPRDETDRHTIVGLPYDKPEAMICCPDVHFLVYRQPLLELALSFVDLTGLALLLSQ